MDHNDITQIRGMFPCLIRYLPNDIGYLMENLSIYRLDGNKYSHYIDFVMLEESRLYDIGFDTVALRVYMRKSKDGSIKYKHERFIFAPEKDFHIGNEGKEVTDAVEKLRKKLEELIDENQNGSNKAES